MTGAGSNDLSFRALFAPNREHDYFAVADRVPFAADTDRFTTGNAWWLAEMSLLAYVPERDFVAARLARAQFTCTSFFEAASTFGFATANDTAVILVFRGTKIGDMQDLKTDLNLLLEPHAGGGRIHSGFRTALDLVWSDVGSYLATAAPRPVFLAGHSLGAGLATIAAARWPFARALYTFGSPRVGDERFAGTVTTPTHRVVNNNDLVARLPPPIVYHHVGRLAYLDRAGELHDDPDLWQRVRDGVYGHGLRATEVVQRWFTGELDQIALDSLVDHSPRHYALALRALATR